MNTKKCSQLQSVFLKLKNLDLRHYVCIAVTVAFATVTAILFWDSVARLFGAFKDFGLSIAYMFCFLLGFDVSFKPGLTAIPETPSVATPVPSTPSEFGSKFNTYFRTLISAQNFADYLIEFLIALIIIMQCLMFIIPMVILAKMLFKGYTKPKKNRGINTDSKPLKIAKNTYAITCLPIKRFVISMREFLENNNRYLRLWLMIWLINFNIISVLISLLSYYLYFMVSFDTSSLYAQFYRLVLDLSVIFKYWFVWIPFMPFLLLLFDKARKSAGYGILNHLERMNRGLISTLPLAVLITSPMRKGKTTLTTDMALSQAVLFRRKSYELLVNNSLKFPNFPWVCFERELRRAMDSHKVYNLATCRKFVNESQFRFYTAYKSCAKRGITPKSISPDNINFLFNYDFKRYGLYYDDSLKQVSIWETLETYVQLYFMFVIQTSFIVSNYSIREDDSLMDLGHFPRWHNDFFRRKTATSQRLSRYAHIMDFDMLRLGTKILKYNKKRNVFEFGIITWTEGGKDRGNMLETKDKDRKDKNANQLNDLINLQIKMIGHSAMVDNFCFVWFVMDEQRAMSVGADLREVCELVHIRERSEPRLTLKLCAAEELLCDVVVEKFKRSNEEYRFVRSDNTLFMHIFTVLASKLYGYRKKIYNRFSYEELIFEHERGSQDGKRMKRKYYIIPQKIYRNRFATDCFRDYFNERALTSKLGLQDLETFSSSRAELSELRKEGSYFIRELDKVFIQKR
ncbi:MAG: hypothetical protein FWD49_04725 [Firmicutes bacterium]|nr:hypothetical protein [Bacillota bacterium]